MWDLVVIELPELRTVFCTYEQFVICLCNVFKISNVRKSSWNGIQVFLWKGNRKTWLTERKVSLVSESSEPNMIWSHWALPKSMALLTIVSSSRRPSWRFVMRPWNNVLHPPLSSERLHHGRGGTENLDYQDWPLRGLYVIFFFFFKNLFTVAVFFQRSVRMRGNMAVYE